MTAILENDTLEGLPSLGTQIGGFLTGIAPGLGMFILYIGIFTAVVLVLVAIAGVIRTKIGSFGGGRVH